jgi:hypothetical protein
MHHARFSGLLTAMLLLGLSAVAAGLWCATDIDCLPHESDPGSTVDAAVPMDATVDGVYAASALSSCPVGWPEARTWSPPCSHLYERPPTANRATPLHLSFCPLLC